LYDENNPFSIIYHAALNRAGIGTNHNQRQFPQMPQMRRQANREVVEECK